MPSPSHHFYLNIINLLHLKSNTVKTLDMKIYGVLWMVILSACP